MNGIMTIKELWAGLILSVLCWTGLWRITTQIGAVLRYDKHVKILDALEHEVDVEHHVALARLYFSAQICRVVGLIFSVLCGLSLAGVFPMTRLSWWFIIPLFLWGLSLAGQGRNLLGGKVPSWMIPRAHKYYEGYDEGFKRLPEGANQEAKAFFAAGNDKELQKQYDVAIQLYEQALAKEPDFVKCMTAKGILHCRKGENEQGLHLFQKAAQLSSESSIVLHLLARVEKQMGLKEESKIHEEKARQNLDKERSRESLVSE
ncbi:MAG: hypothetical protein ABSE89_02535 [Sedimentisphaerales bacterium]